ncbi:hypothetical protein ABT160_11930 [Streptomyces sp. NPDC001941]|uniref:hypothetical protein n=1 Tax=Streptomyces sp. NPDC001941 TaxID=3154659 RepID=UPI00331869EF
MSDSTGPEGYGPEGTTPEHTGRDSTGPEHTGPEHTVPDSPASDSPAPDSHRARWLPPVACAVLALSVLFLVLAGTARATLLSRPFYQAVLDEQDAYERLYDEVLVDPATARVTRDLLGRLPVPQAQVTANLKNVLPPSTLRTLVDEQIGHAVGYLRGDEQPLRLTVDLRPVLTNIGGLAEIYLGDLVASVQGRDAPDFPGFVRELGAALDDLAAGRRPDVLPELALEGEQAARAADWLVRAVPEKEREGLRPQVEAALATGDVASALAAVGPYALGDRAEGAAADLGGLTDGGHWNVVPDLAAAGYDLSTVNRIRAFTRLALGTVQTGAVLLGLAAVAVLVLTGSRTWPVRLRRVGAGLLAGGLLAAAVVALLWWQLRDLAADPPAAWPSSLRTLVEDLRGAAGDGLGAVGLLTAALPVVAGLLLWGGTVLYERVLARRAGGWPARRRTAAVAVGAGAVTVLALAGAVLVPAVAGKDARDLCLGSAALCGKRYDEVAVVATHNAMSTTQDRFIGPLQDPGIVAQLDAGARALLIDTYTWEKPEEVAGRLAEADIPADLKERITSLVARANPPRPGLWLCHGVCRAGAVPLVETLRRIGTWLDAHPGEVLTLVVEDSVTGEQTRDAFRRAGLERLLFTPAADPARPWPTLGEMVRSGRRLVVFAENADGPAPWYRNFYRYGMETPYAFGAPGEMSCVPHRGGEGKRLFLLNHFITDQGGSRLDAAVVNTRAFILERARRCARERGRPVNLVAVDFATIGDAKGAVDALNRER